MDPCIQAFLNKFSADTEKLIRNLANFNKLAEDRNKPRLEPLDPPPSGSGCDKGNSGFRGQQCNTLNQNNCEKSDSNESTCYQPPGRIPPTNYKQPQPQVQPKQQIVCSKHRSTHNQPNSYQEHQTPCNPNDLKGISKDHYLRYHTAEGENRSKPSKAGIGNDNAGGYMNAEDRIKLFVRRFNETERTLRSLRSKLEDLNYVMKNRESKKAQNQNRNVMFENRTHCQLPQCPLTDPNEHYNPSSIGLPMIDIPEVPPITKSRNSTESSCYEVMEILECPSSSVCGSQDGNHNNRVSFC